MAQSKPSYEDDDYEWIDHKSKVYSNIFHLRAREGLMIHEKMEEEAIYFTGSDYFGSNYGFSMHPETLHPAALREHERRSTSTAPNNKSKQSLEVVIRRVCELLTLSQSHFRFVLHNLIRNNIKSNHDLYIAIHEANYNEFVALIKDNDAPSHAFGSNIHKEFLFLKQSATYMLKRWGYDHEYYQRMIERSNRMLGAEDDEYVVDNTQNKEDKDSAEFDMQSYWDQQETCPDNGSYRQGGEVKDNGQEDAKLLCLTLRDGTNCSIPISLTTTTSDEVVQILSQLDNRDKRVPFIKGSKIPVTLSDGREVIVSHEPTFAGGTPQKPPYQRPGTSFMISSHRRNKDMASALLKGDQVRTIRRKKRDGRIKSRVVSETLWYRDPTGRLESSDIVHV